MSLIQHILRLCVSFLLIQELYSQSPSFKTYMNPVIPGDHPDCTLTKIGNYFYTTGSSFNPTPKIYRSTDLVHWEVIAQPVSASWSGYGDSPSGGCWGGQMVYRNGKYWHFFFRGTMYYVTANSPEGPWSNPTAMVCPASVPGLGYDNSIFIDDNNKWYLIVKNGQVNNWIVELGDNGQPSGAIYDLRWINPAPTYPNSWAEGPVMWKYNGYYFYSFARDVSGGQKVMRSSTLTANQASWTMLGDLFNMSDPKKPQALFGNPNHSSASMMLSDSTNWVIHPVYYTAGNDWRAQGRQGLLNQLRYDTTSRPLADYPINEPLPAPKLPSSGIPWMVPKSDFFESNKLNPDWSFCGYTATSAWSLTTRPGWLRMQQRTNKSNTLIKNDAEHNYSAITRLDFNPLSANDEAGIRLSTAADTIYVKVYSSYNGSKQIIGFCNYKTKYEVTNTIGDTLWLKLNRFNHIITGYYSKNGLDWIQVGQPADVTTMDSNVDMNNWSGQKQGLYVSGTQSAYFDLYIYRDAYSVIPTDCPANQYGTSRVPGILYNIQNNDWALYAGVEFQNKEYGIIADSVQFYASSYSTGGFIEIWLDSIDTGTKIGTCKIEPTGNWTVYKNFKAKVSHVTGRHDVYLKFTGSGTSNLIQLKNMQFIAKKAPKYIKSEVINDSVISVTLDQAISTPILPAGFSILMNGIVSAEIINASLSNGDSTILLTLNRKIVVSDSIRISYSSGTVKTSEGLYLAPFSNLLVKNTITGISKLPIEQNSRSLTIFPNPAQTTITLKNSNPFNKVLIYNSLGKEVYAQKLSKSLCSFEIQVNLPSGIYLVIVTGTNIQASSHLIIK